MTYRVGNQQPQNIYRGEQYIGVMFSPEDAALVVAALNKTREGSTELDALIDNDGDRWTRVGADEFRLEPQGSVRSRTYIEGAYGPVAEVWA